MCFKLATTKGVRDTVFSKRACREGARAMDSAMAATCFTQVGRLVGVVEA